MTNHPVRRRFWVEVILGSISLALLALTLITREWIELLFGVDPDGVAERLSGRSLACSRSQQACLRSSHGLNGPGPARATPKRL